MTRKKRNRVGSEEQYGPRPVGEILNEILQNGDSPLAVAYRDRLHPNTELCVDLKLLTRQPGRLPVGKSLGGALAHNGEQEYTFVEGQPKVTYRRYPLVFSGFYVNIHRHDDGTLHPSLKRVAVTEDFDIEGYAKVVALELNRALNGLVKKK
jgi:hypothetical protein